MKYKNEQDERVIAQNRKILSEVYSILVIVLIASVIVQQFVFNAPFKQYAVEFFCFMGSSFYIIIRRLILGLNVFNEKKQRKTILTTGIVTGLTVAIVNGVQSYTRYENNYKDNLGAFAASILITCVSAVASSLAVLYLIWLLNTKRQEQIQKRFDDED